MWTSSVSRGRLDTGTSSVSTGRLDTGTSSVSTGRLDTGTSSVSTGSLDTGTSSVSTGRLDTGTSSVSTGCFVFKPRSRKRHVSSAETHFSRGCEDTTGSALRFGLCRRLWEQIRTGTESLQDHLNRTVLDGLLDFTRKCRFPRRDAWSREIPAAALLLGVNVPDHDATLQRLCALLRRSVTPHVASLQAEECASLRHVMERVMERVMDADTSRGPCSLKVLCDWYDARTDDALPPVVIIFKDLEAFNPKVLQEFIQICSRHVQQLPLAFIFGIATCPSAIHKMFPHSVSCLLCVELFPSLSCTQHLATVMDEFLLTHSFPFKLSGKVMQVLLSIFLYHDFSVRNFIKGLQVALLEHFHAQPLSVLCCGEDEALRVLDTLCAKDLQRIRQLASFKSHVESLQTHEQVQLMTNDATLREECKRLITSLHQYHQNYFPALKCLHALTSSLPRYPLGKQIRELHLICVEKRVWDSEEYGTSLKLLRLLSRDELCAGVQTCVQLLQEASTMKHVRVQFEQVLCKLQALDECEDTASPQEAEPVVTSPLQHLGKRTDLFRLQKTLLELNEARRVKRLSRFELVRNQTVELVHSLVQSFLPPPESQPLHEVLYFCGAGVVRRHLNAAPRTCVQAALSDPFLFLQTPEGVSAATPDICLVYKLHLECGRLINVRDWLEAFCTVACAAEGGDSRAEGGDSRAEGGDSRAEGGDSRAEGGDSRPEDFGRVDEARHARFIQAVSELEFMGFIKSSRQKTDHVARLTWGGC